MRSISSQILESRKKKTLQVVIYHYITTKKPVGSEIVCEEYNFGLSPASIRKIMTELENDGYIFHPHTSAGRIPTDKGYRWFVDSIVELQNIVGEERKKIVDEFRLRVREFDDLFVRTSHLLSLVSNYAGFILAAKPDRNKLKYLELLKLSDNKILVLMVTDSGYVKHQVIQISTLYPVEENTLREISQILNERFSGTCLCDFKGMLKDVIDEMDKKQKEIRNIVKIISDKLFQQEEQLYINGITNILPVLDKNNYNELSYLLKLTEQKKLLTEMLEKDIEKLKGVEVTIGKEHQIPELSEFSFVKSVYKLDDRIAGVLGIIGPKRMEYPKMISLVSFVANLVSKIVAKISNQ